MTLLRHLSRSSAQAGLLCNISRAFGPKSDRPFSSSKTFRQSLSSSSRTHQNTPAFSGPSENYKSNLSIMGARFMAVKAMDNVSLPSVLNFRNFIHSGKPNADEMDGNFRHMDFVRLIEEEGGSQFSQNNVEQNPDVLHIKMLRNNTFITLTDSKGNKKPGRGVSATAGSLPNKGGKSGRFDAEATAEHVGRRARDAGIKSVVVKVNGFTYFKKKRQAIMSFREGYTHSRGDQTPIVAIEDTTRRPHNGCRLPKKRRI